MGKRLGKKVSIKTILNKRCYAIIDYNGNIDITSIESKKQLCINMAVRSYQVSWSTLLDIGFNCVRCVIYVEAS